MIVWSGRGFLIVLVLLATLFLCISILPNEYRDYGFVISTFSTGGFSWFFGRKWNRRNERTVIDEKSGQRLKIGTLHTLFWIPMQYWGFVLPVLGIIILFQNSPVLAIITSITLLALILFIVFNQKAKSESKFKNLAKSNVKRQAERKQPVNASETISELKEQSSINKEFKPSDHSKFMP
ncbi:hypothetical protein [Flagellimonas sp.]|uniref:hypothetical protein n=1 Tax=Flagellimonas sp. TaxID=2058762 RepID=UPI003F4A705A